MVSVVLKSRVKAPDWSANDDPERDAKCRHFPLPRNHDVRPETDPWFYDMEESASVCIGEFDNRPCPFLGRCLFGSLLNNEGSGTFGGFLPIQRKWIRRNVPKSIWHRSNLWRHLVPPLEFFEEDEDAEADDA